jgi:hypothetical protein
VLCDLQEFEQQIMAKYIRFKHFFTLNSSFFRVFLLAYIGLSISVQSSVSIAQGNSCELIFSGELTSSFSNRNAPVIKVASGLTGVNSSLSKTPPFPVAKYFQAKLIEDHYLNEAQALLIGINKIGALKIFKYLAGGEKKIKLKQTKINNFNQLRAQAQKVRGLMKSLGVKNKNGTQNQQTKDFKIALEIFNDFVTAWGKIKDQLLVIGKKSKPRASNKQSKKIVKKSNKSLDILKKYSLEEILGTFMVTEPQQLHEYLKEIRHKIHNYLNQHTLLTGWEYHDLRKELKVLRWLVMYIQKQDPNFSFKEVRPQLSYESQQHFDRAMHTSGKGRVTSLPHLLKSLKSIVAALGKVHNGLVERKDNDSDFDYHNHPVVEISQETRVAIKKIIPRIDILFNTHLE